MSDSDASRGAAAAGARPRPQYGEYATPEEQRARIRQPDVSWELETGRIAPEAEPVAPVPAPQAAAIDPEKVRSRSVDRIVTFALLAYGLVNVVSSFPALVDHASYAETIFGLMGVDAELSDPGAGRPWGVAAAVVLAIGWMITAAVSWWSVRRGRISWWIPLIGGIVFTGISAILMLVPIFNDPAVWDAMIASVR